MKFSIVAAACLQVTASLAAPLVFRDLDGDVAVFHSNGGAGSRSMGGAGGRGGAASETGGEGAGEGAGAGGETGGEGSAEGGEGGEGGEGEAENEVELQAQFDQAVTLEGGDLKQDALYPPGTNGGFEVEFQNQVGNVLAVSENTAPGAPPAGFVAVEPVSYIVQLGEDAAGATLQKIDYILTAGNTLDISKGKVGKFDAASATFIIDDTIGELEFEVEENELTLTVADLNGEWGIFVPDAAAGGDAGAGAGGEAGGDAGAGAPTTGNTILDSVLKLIGEGAAAADAAAAAGAGAAA